MTGLIMQEYLIWLDNKIQAQGRKVYCYYIISLATNLGYNWSAESKVLHMYELNSFLRILRLSGNRWISV